MDEPALYMAYALFPLFICVRLSANQAFVQRLARYRKLILFFSLMGARNKPGELVKYAVILRVTFLYS